MGKSPILHENNVNNLMFKVNVKNMGKLPQKIYGKNIFTSNNIV